MGFDWLPTGWAIAKVSEAVSVEGIISDGDWVESKDQDLNGDVRLIQLADIGDGDFRNKSERFMTKPNAIRMNCTFLKDGDVLIARMPDPLGRACIFPGVGQEAVTVVDICLVRLPQGSALQNKILMHWINNPEIRNGIVLQATGTTRKRITRKKLEELELPIPPLAEQHQIAAKLDELLAQVDSIKTRLDAIPHILKRFRQSVLAAAVSGKLTEDWRINNVNSDQNLAYPSNKLGDIEEKEKYFSTPTQWIWVRLGSQVKLINGDRGKNYPNSSEYVSEGLPFINTGHIEPNGFLSKERMNYISRAKFDSLGGGKIEPNDLVYCLRGATMGKTAMVAPLKEGAIASSLVIVRPNDSMTTKFTYIFLVSPQGKDLILRYDNGSAQPNLSAKSLGLYPLALPSIPEQNEIVRRVEQLFAYTDQIEQRVKDALDRVNHLTQSILAKAFRGELTADWRAQNPDLINGENNAEALLARIQAARVAEKPKLKRKLKA